MRVGPAAEERLSRCTGRRVCGPAGVCRRGRVDRVPARSSSLGGRSVASTVAAVRRPRRRFRRGPATPPRGRRMAGRVGAGRLDWATRPSSVRCTAVGSRRCSPRHTSTGCATGVERRSRRQWAVCARPGLLRASCACDLARPQGTCPRPRFGRTVSVAGPRAWSGSPRTPGSGGASRRERSPCGPSRACPRRMPSSPFDEGPTIATPAIGPGFTWPTPSRIGLRVTEISNALASRDFRLHSRGDPRAAKGQASMVSHGTVEAINGLTARWAAALPEEGTVLAAARRATPIKRPPADRGRPGGDRYVRVRGRWRGGGNGEGRATPPSSRSPTASGTCAGARVGVGGPRLDGRRRAAPPGCREWRRTVS